MKGRVLVVDDDANMRESISDNLEVAGYEVAGASSGAEALAALEARFYDVILMDFNLKGGETGFDVIKRIRKFNEDSQIVMLTGNTQLETAINAMREQVTDFLTKPVDFDLLKLRITKAFERLDLLRKLRHLNEMKSKFMSMASHDLSNSLMTLQVSFEMLSQTLSPDAEQKKRMIYISNGIGQIARLIDDLVDWAAIEQGKFRLELSSFAPGQMVEETLVGPQGRAQARGIALSGEIEAGLPAVSADKRRITQVLNNLLENAIRHTLKGGRIQVQVSRQGAEIRIAVRDSGEGIAPQEVGRIFQSFYQGSGGSPGGRLGLGLSIAKEIVEAHKGRLWVESPGLGQGATFFFTIPVPP